MAMWRQMAAGDIDGLLKVAEKMHPDLPEGRGVFAERLRLFPVGCLVLVQDGEVCGYAVSHPIRADQPPSLNSFLGEIPLDAAQYFFHDLTILPNFRQRGLAAECIGRLLEIAKVYPTTSLVSVYNTASFWGRFGFMPEPVDEILSKKLRIYGQDAIYLKRQNHQ
jgi:GNAT superfamily N-acetyltransferase